MTYLVESGLHTSTAERRIPAILHYHKLAGQPAPATAGARAVLSGARRQISEVSLRKNALTVDQLQRSMKTFGSCPSAVRNRAILALGFASAMRRSELAALNLCDIEFVPGSGVVVQIRRSKTDQTGRGEQLGIPPANNPDLCPVGALLAWLDVRGTWDGPLFTPFAGRAYKGRRLSPDGISQVVKRGAQSIGLDPGRYGGHSLRAGCVTAAIQSGASDLAIMQRTRHKKVSTLQRYVRPATLFSVNPLANVL